MEKSKKGIIFYRTKYNTYYYINFKGEHIMFDKPMINDPIYKDIMVKNARQYTKRGYDNAIHSYHYIIDNFVNKDWIIL